MTRTAIILALLIGLGTAAPSRAGTDCEEAINEYKNAVVNATDMVIRYRRCLDNGDPADDCSSEFRKVKSAQSDLENAASNYSGYCRD